MSAFLYFFNNVFFLGEQQVLASDQAVLSIKARMKIIKNVSVSYDDHFIGNPFKVEAKGMKLENLIKVKISYNGYRPIKLILKQKKQSDSDAENSETQVWMKFALDNGYVKINDIAPIMDLSNEVGKLLGDMIAHPEKWCRNTK